MASQPKRKLTTAERRERRQREGRAFARFVVHPNRSELGPDEPGRNGHFRAVHPAPPRPPAACTARIMFPQPWHGYGAAEDGSMILTASHWRSVLAGARSVAEDYGVGEVLPPFGFTDRQRGPGWFWWDGSRTDHNILETENAHTHVRRYLEGLFPGTVVELEDRR